MVWIAALALALAGCAGDKDPNPPPAAVADSHPAPARSELEVAARLGPGMEFPHVFVTDQMGNRYDLYNLLAKPKNVVLLLDAFCPACGEEAEKIQRLVQMRPQLNVLGVSKDSLPAVLAFKKRHALLFPVLLDGEEKLVPDYRRATFPTLVVVNQDRQILRLYEGPIPPAQAGPLMQWLMN